MTVLTETDFEAEAIDLGHIPGQDEIYPGDPNHYIGPLDAELRLIGTRKKYQVSLWWDFDGNHDGIGITIWTGTDAANEGLNEHAENGGLLKVVLGAVHFKARITISRYGDFPSIGDLFRHRPMSWGLRGDPYLWTEMRDYFDGWYLPQNLDELEQRIAKAFRNLTGAPMDTEEPIYSERYNMGGMSSGHISPDFWRNGALEHLREQFEFDKGWKRPPCPSCGSTAVASIAYGFPGPEMFEDEERGDIVLGGCCVTEDDPEWNCRDCEHRW